jgi:hypothetical protein
LLIFQKAREEGEEVEEEGYTVSREITIKENMSLKKYLRYRENNVITSVRMYSIYIMGILKYILCTFRSSRKNHCIDGQVE